MVPRQIRRSHARWVLKNWRAVAAATPIFVSIADSDVVERLLVVYRLSLRR